METPRSPFNPSDFIRFVEFDERNTSPKATAFIVKLTPAVALRWRDLCDRHGLHRMRALRDCFAAALRAHLEAAGTQAAGGKRHAEDEPAARGLSPRPLPHGAYSPWTSQSSATGAEDRAAADDSDSRFGF